MDVPEHGLSRYYNQKCRCQVCSAAAVVAGRELRARRRAGRQEIEGRLVAVKAPAHGRPSTYKGWACRCTPCVDANSAEVAQRKASRGVPLTGFVRRVGDEWELRCADCACSWRRPASQNGGMAPERCPMCSYQRERTLDRAQYGRVNAEKIEAARVAKLNRPSRKERKRQYRQSSAYLKWREEYAARPEVQERARERRRSAEARERTRLYRASSPDYAERQRVAQRKFRETEHTKAYGREAARIRRARLAKADVRSISPRDERRLRGQQACFYCGVVSAETHVDHVIPIIAGGRHAIGNLVPSCRRCNIGTGKWKHLLAVARYRRGFKVQWSAFVPPSKRAAAA